MSLSSYPQAILHVDGDAFFASVEQAVNPQYKGKPLISGAERGIIAAASYEAKALGIKRGLTIRDAKKICPDLIVVPTDYETCSLYSKRMMDIIRRFSPLVEEYSIDEGFADITGLRRVFHCSYEDIARKIQSTIKEELDLSVSVGLSLSKGLSKICSDFRKPHGIVCVPSEYINILLSKTKISEVWGIGKNTEQLLKKYNIFTALDYINSEIRFIENLLGKLGIEMYRELKGEYIYKINPDLKTVYQSVSKSKTFSPPTKEKTKVKAFLIRNLESACIKIRRHNLIANKVYIAIKNQKFQYRSIEAKLSKSTSDTLELVHIVNKLFENIFEPDEYRATLIILSDLKENKNKQNSLFDDPIKIENMEKVSNCIDYINQKFGKHTVHLGSSLKANNQHNGARGEISQRKANLLKGENLRQKLNIPMSFMKI